MDFLDSLENSLKSLESQEERDPAAQQRRDDQRQQVAATAPWAEKLKESAYTRELFEKAAVMSHRLRSKIYMAWLENNLRLEVRGRWCELRPTPGGIEAEYVKLDGSLVKAPLQLEGDPQDLLASWLDESPAQTVHPD
jgi:hypothetical protein